MAEVWQVKRYDICGCAYSYKGYTRDWTIPRPATVHHVTLHPFFQPFTSFNLQISLKFCPKKLQLTPTLADRSIHNNLLPNT